MAIIRVTTVSGRQVEYEDEIIGSGGMKDVYMSPDRSYVVAYFRDDVDIQGRERLKAIVGQYRTDIFGKEGGEYWEDLYCWPDDIVEHDGRIGVVAPVYHDRFFFSYGSINNDMLLIKGKEKEGKWFSSASNREKFLDPREKGDWLTHLQLALRISRAVRRLHAAGLAHSDLSYKNVLVDPSSGTACIIDIDGLVVRGKYPPDVVGTPDFIAPEVVATQGLPKDDDKRVLPSTSTDRHALAVLIYVYLLYRHPLRGKKVHDPDPNRDEEIGMGDAALFIEHPTDFTNSVNTDDLNDNDLPWGDPNQMPFTITGPYLSDLFRRAFIDGLHQPQLRPSASDWELALIKTIDMIQPCSNSDCTMGWYVFDNTRQPTCPYCHTTYDGALPVLNLYSIRSGSTFKPDNHRVMVWNGQSLNAWHANRLIAPNERLTPDQRRRLGYFQLHQGDWYLVNEGMPDLQDVGANQPIPIGGNVKLTDGLQLLLSREDGGRLVQVQLING